MFFRIQQRRTMMQKWIFICGLMTISSLGISQDKTAYIELYKNIAISEMVRSGIPASIKLAQGILESNCGKSDLACKANNHFGIKCGNDWRGKSFKKEDDDYEEGKLVKSCFREFSTVYDSYIAHTDFLMDPSKSNRYGFLFKLESTDYKSWAKGLSKAGYATDPEYAHRLIDIIEKYELFQYDSPHPGDFASHEKKIPKTHASSLYHNDVRYTLAQTGDTPLSFAERNDVTVKQVIRYNDDIDEESQELIAGSRVYLQPKRNQNNGHQKVHLIKPGENLVSISQHYGIKLEALQKRNGLASNEIPAPNQKLVLKGKTKSKLRTVNPYEAPPVIPQKEIPQVISENTETASTQKSIPVPVKEIKPDTNKTSIPAKAPVASKPIAVQHASISIKTETPTHIVGKGETLYAVSRQYGISVAELKKMNNLSADTIFVGQKLILR